MPKANAIMNHLWAKITLKSSPNGKKLPSQDYQINILILQNSFHFFHHRLITWSWASANFVCAVIFPSLRLASAKLCAVFEGQPFGK